MDKYAGFWVRIVAWFLDLLIIYLPALILVLLLYGVGAVDAMQYLPTLAAVMIILYMEGQGATPGKRILGLAVVGEDGKNIGTIGALFRYLGKILCSAALGIGFIMIGIDAKKQGWHDKLAKTYVIYRAFGKT